MKRESLIIGIIIGLLAGLLISTLFFKSNVGRYQISDAERWGRIIFDTKTGTYLWFWYYDTKPKKKGNFDEMLKELEKGESKNENDTIPK